MKLPDMYQDEFLSLCLPSESDVPEVAPPNCCVKYEFVNIAKQAPLHGVNWRNYSGPTEPSNYKLVHLDEDDAALLREVYAVMYPGREIEMANLAETNHLGHFKFGQQRLDQKCNLGGFGLARF